MSDIEKIKEEVKAVDANMEVTDEAAEKLLPIPSMFRGMAIKAMVKKANDAGVTTLDAEFVAKVQKESGFG
jgi:hypothetical protein